MGGKRVVGPLKLKKISFVLKQWTNMMSSYQKNKLASPKFGHLSATALQLSENKTICNGCWSFRLNTCLHSIFLNIFKIINI